MFQLIFMNQKLFSILTFKVKPNKRETKIIKKEGEIYYLDLAATPVDNQANKELIRFVSQEFKIPKSNIEIVSGKTSRLKRLKIY